jgi:hypothetical protein
MRRIIYVYENQTEFFDREHDLPVGWDDIDVYEPGGSKPDLPVSFFNQLAKQQSVMEHKLDHSR